MQSYLCVIDILRFSRRTFFHLRRPYGHQVSGANVSDLMDRKTAVVIFEARNWCFRCVASCVCIAVLL